MTAEPVLEPDRRTTPPAAASDGSAHAVPETAAAGPPRGRRANPIDLNAAFDSFEQLWSPRIVARVNDYDIRIAKVAGEHVWHAHSDTDEFFLVLAGTLHITMRDEPGGGERVVVMNRGEVFVVPRGVEHRPASPAGASILLVEPTGTLSVGDCHDALPGHVEATTGHALA
jgi:mannose-6-phosphate isomerase-like protein (cupin superfamily)